MRRMTRLLFAISLFAPQAADAFCGFFVSGADAKLYNNASQVVLMRKGNRTVMTMSNNYKGPPEDFAMVVPVPVVLQKQDVRTLASDVFEHIDQLSAPPRSASPATSSAAPSAATTSSRRSTRAS